MSQSNDVKTHKGGKIFDCRGEVIGSCDPHAGHRFEITAEGDVTGESRGDSNCKDGTLQRDLIARMLMNGSSDDSQAPESKGRDITGGMIYGYDRHGTLGEVDASFFKDATY